MGIKLWLQKTPGAALQKRDEKIMVNKKRVSGILSQLETFYRVTMRYIFYVIPRVQGMFKNPKRKIQLESRLGIKKIFNSP